DDAFKAHALRGFEELWAAADHMVAELEAASALVFSEQFAQPFAAVLNALATKVAAIEMEEVERDEDETLRVLSAELAAQGVEVGLAARPLDDDFAVEDGAPAVERTGLVEDGSIKAAPVQARAGQGTYPVAIDDQLGAVAVIFELVQPVVAFGGFFGEGRGHRLDE